MHREHASRWWIAGAAFAGVLATRLVARPEGRRLARTALRHAFGVKELIESELERMREDIADFVAEAREEHRQAKCGETEPRV